MLSRPMILVFLLAALAALGWAALSGEVAPVPRASGVGRESAPEAGAAPSRLSPELRSALAALPALRGEPLTSEALEGQVVLVTFFASWCGPCREELEQLKALHGAYAPFGLRIIAVNWFETFDGLSDDKRLAAYLERLDPPYAVVAGDEAAVRAFGGITRIPTLFLFDRNGRPALRFENVRGGSGGTVDLGTLHARVGELL